MALFLHAWVRLAPEHPVADEAEEAAVCTVVGMAENDLHALYAIQLQLC